MRIDRVFPTLIIAACAVFGVAGCGTAALESETGLVDVPGGRVFYERSGPDAKGTPLLLIHGGPGGTSCWFASLDSLAVDRPVIRYDQLGTGLSDRPDDQNLWTVSRAVDEVDAIRDALGLDRLHILGLSWGGTVAAAYALTGDTEGLQSIIFAGPLLSTPVWLEDARGLVDQLPAEHRDAIRRHEAAGTFDDPEYVEATQAFYDRFLFHVQPIPHYPECDGVNGNAEIYEYMWGPSEFTSTGTLLDYDRRADLHRIAFPSILVAGEYDEARPETMRLFARMMPDAETAVIPDAGHMAMVDQPAAYMEVVREFLARVESE